MIPSRISDRLVPCPMTGCYLWEGATNEKGYAVVWYGGKRRKLSRVLFKLTRGRWPRRDRQMLHTCDTPACGEPRHHREGTASQNMRDCYQKGRSRGFVNRKAA